jgi:uncharacterized protein (TIGR02453 family)
MSRFPGFSNEGLRFLKQLPKNNDRDWFKDNRAAFDEGIVEPGKLLVSALGEKLTTLDADVHAEPKVGGSIFRQHRDTRFSKDKSPYKTHFDLWFWTGDKKGWDASGFFVRVTGAELWVGVGMHALDKRALSAYRAAVGDDTRGKELVKIVTKLRKAGLEVGDVHYKRVPKPFAQDHPRAELLKHNTLHATARMPLPEEAKSNKLVGLIHKQHKQMAPLHRWLRSALAAG